MTRNPEAEIIAEAAAARRFNEVMSRPLIQPEYRELGPEAARLGVPSGGRFLDVGTGPGFVAIEISLAVDNRAKGVGLDLSPAMLALAAENAARRGVASRVDWVLGDAAALPFPAGHFDLVVSSGSLHHWSEPRAVFAEIGRVLKPHGRCLIRDSKRISDPAAKVAAGLIGLTLPADFRRHYWNSIASSYRASELRAIVERSGLRNARVDESFFDLVVTVADPVSGPSGT